MPFFRRGVKYPEGIMNNTKSPTSVMFAGSATGDLLPVYVVYKAEHLYDTWTKDSPAGARFNRSKSRWFDRTTFKDRFYQVILPYFRGRSRN